MSWTRSCRRKVLPGRRLTPMTIGRSRLSLPAGWLMGRSRPDAVRRECDSGPRATTSFRTPPLRQRRDGPPTLCRDWASVALVLRKADNGNLSARAMVTATSAARREAAVPVTGSGSGRRSPRISNMLATTDDDCHRPKPPARAPLGAEFAVHSAGHDADDEVVAFLRPKATAAPVA
jgi:hypothetical protein